MLSCFYLTNSKETWKLRDQGPHQTILLNLVLFIALYELSNDIPLNNYPYLPSIYASIYRLAFFRWLSNHDSKSYVTFSSFWVTKENENENVGLWKVQILLNSKETIHAFPLILSIFYQKATTSAFHVGTRALEPITVKSRYKTYTFVI